MKNQERFDELLTLFVDGEITADQQKEFDQLIEQNPEWKQQAEEEKRLVELMRRAPKATAPINLIQSVMESVHDVQPVAPPEPAPEKKKSNKLIVIGFATAAAAAVTLGAISTMMMSGDTGEERTVARAEVKKEAANKEWKEPVAPSQSAPVPAATKAEPESQSYFAGREITPVQSTDEFYEQRSRKDPYQVGDADRNTKTLQNKDIDLKLGSAPSYGIGNDSKTIASDSFGAPPSSQAFSSVDSDGDVDYYSAPADMEQEEQPVDTFAMEAPGHSNTASDFGNFDVRTEELAFYYSDSSSEPTTLSSKIDSLEAADQEQWKMLSKDQQPAIDVASFETFMSWTKQNKGQFLFYTPDQEVAFHVCESAEDFLAKFKTTEEKEETTSRKKLATRSLGMTATARKSLKETPTPIPPNAKSGYVLFHFPSKKEATKALEEMKNLEGEGLKNLDFDKAVLVDQPDGVRLVIPYELLKIDDE